MKFHGDEIVHWNGKDWLLSGHTYTNTEIDAAAVPELLKNRRIVRVQFEPSEGSFPQGNSLHLELDDGSVIRIAGWGYDGWGTDVEICTVDDSNAG